MNEYDSLINEGKETEYDALVPTVDSRKQDFAGASYVASQANPDDEAQKIKLADEMDLPVDFVKRNYDKLTQKKSAQNLESEYDRIIADAPKTADFLTDPNNLSVSKDDLSGLKDFETNTEEYSAWSQVGKAIPGGIATAAANLYKTPAFLGNLALIPSNIVNRALGREEVAFAYDNYFSKQAEAVAQSYNKDAPLIGESAVETANLSGIFDAVVERDFGKIADEIKKGDFSKAGKILSLQAVSSAPNTIAGLAATIANPAAGAAFFTGTSGAAKASEMQAEGFSPTQSATQGLAFGSIEAFFEKFGSTSILKAFNKKLVNEVGETAAKSVMLEAVKPIVNSAASNFSEEAITSLAQDFTDYVTDVNPDAMKGSFSRALEAGGSGFIMGAGISAPSLGVDAYRYAQEKRQAQLNKETFLAMGDSAAASKLKQRLPEKYKQYVDQVTKDGPVSDVYIPVEAMEKFFQAKNITPAQAAQELGVLKEYNEAKETGTDIKIPTSVVATNLAGTEYYQGLADDIKFSPDQKTVNESKADQELARQQLKELDENPIQERESSEQEYQAIKQDIVNQRVQTGSDRKGAQFEGELFASGVTAMSQLAGLSPREVYQRYGLKISRADGLPDLPDQQVLNQTKTNLFIQPMKSKRGEYVFKNANDESSANVKFEKSTQGDGTMLSINNFTLGSLDVASDIIKAAENMAVKNNARLVVVTPESFTGFTDKTAKAGIKVFTDAGFKPVKTADGRVVMQKEIAETRLFQKKDNKNYKFDAETGEYSKGNVEANVSQRNDDMLEDLAKGLSDVVDGQALEINTLEVPPDEQGSGKGSQALKDLEQIARDQGERFIVLKAEPLQSQKVGPADPKNLKKLIKFYQDNGYKIHKKNKTNAIMYKDVSIDTILQQQSDNSPLGQFRFGKNRQFFIDLFEKADKSTFLHETSHAFLEIFGDLATAEGATPEIKDLYQQSLDWMGVKSRDEIKTEHHELWARTFEEYLKTGQAPTSKLRKAFNTFKVWLLNIYKGGVVPDSKLTPEIKGIFDRILATQQEIDQASDKMGGPGMFGDPMSAGMNAEQSLQYLTAKEEHRLTAEEQLNKKLMQDLIKKQDKAYKETFDKLYAEELAVAQEMPEFKAIAAIQGDMKLNTDVVSNEYAVFKEVLPNKSTSVEGMHPDLVAGALGFENGQAMLQAIAPYRRGIEFYVEQQVATEMRIKYPELLTSPELSEEALKAAHNENAAKLKRMEMELFFKEDQKITKNVAASLIKKVPSDKAIKEQAAKMIGDKKVSEIKPFRFLSAEKKYAGEAAKAYKRGDFAAAFEAKRLEYLNFELYRAATEAQDTVKKEVKNFKKLFKSDEDIAKTRDVDLVNAARSVLALYGITRADKSPQEYIDKIKTYDPDTYSVIFPLVTSITENAQNYQNISYQEFVDMKDSVQGLWDLAKSQNEMVVDGQVIKKQDAIDQLAARAIELADGKEIAGYDKAITDKERRGFQFLGLLARYRKIEHWAFAFDKGDINGPATRFITRPIFDAQTQFDLKKVEVYKKLEETVKNLNIDSTKAVEASEIGYTFKNKQDLLHAVIHSGNQSNLEKLLVGRKWGEIRADGTLNTSKWDAMINRMIDDGTLTKVDFDFAQSIWDLNESLKPAAQKAHKKMYGFYFNEITAKPFTNKFGEYRGGYMPAIVDKEISVDAAMREDKNALEGFNNSFMFPTTGRGFSKTRVDSYYAPLELNLNKITGHIGQVLKFTYLEPAIKDAGKLVNSKEFKNSMAAVDPKIVSDAIIPWLQRSATQRVVVQGASQMFDKMLAALRKNSSMQFMALNVANWFQNTTGLFQVAVRVSPKHIVGSMKDYISNPKGFNEMIMDKSDYMKTRIGETTRDVSKHFSEIVLQPTPYEKVIDAAQNFAYFGERISNALIENVAWNAAYREQLALGKSEADASRIADSTVRQTLVDSSPAGSSFVQTGTPFQRLFTMLSGFFFNSGNLLLTEWSIAKQMGLTTRAGGSRASMAYVMIVMTPAIVSALIMRAFAGQGLDEDDDGEYMDDAFNLLFMSQLRFMTAMVPGGTVANSVLNQFNDKPYDDKINLSPAFSTLESASRAVVSVPKAVVSDGDPNKAIKDALVAIGLFSGLPVGALNKPINYSSKVASGEIESSGPIDYTRGLITGKGPAN